MKGKKYVLLLPNTRTRVRLHTRAYARTHTHTHTRTHAHTLCMALSGIEEGRQSEENRDAAHLTGTYLTRMSLNPRTTALWCSRSIPCSYARHTIVNGRGIGTVILIMKIDST